MLVVHVIGPHAATPYSLLPTPNPTICIPSAQVWPNTTKYNQLLISLQFGSIDLRPFTIHPQFVTISIKYVNFCAFIDCHESHNYALLPSNPQVRQDWWWVDEGACKFWQCQYFTSKVPVTFPSIYHVFEQFAPYRVPFFIRQCNVVANICLQALLIVRHYQQCVAKYLHQGITNWLRTRAQGANLWQVEAPSGGPLLCDHHLLIVRVIWALYKNEVGTRQKLVVHVKKPLSRFQIGVDVERLSEVCVIIWCLCYSYIYE